MCWSPAWLIWFAAPTRHRLGMTKILLFSSHPSAVRPIHGIFVETAPAQPFKTGLCRQAKVGVGLFLSLPRWRVRPVRRHTPRFETRNGVEVHHPRYLLLPAVRRTWPPYAMALGALCAVSCLQRAKV